MSKKPETLFKERCVRDLRPLEIANQIWYFKSNQVSQRGIPDFIMCIGPYFMAIELKMDGEMPDPLQQYNIRQIKKIGALAYVSTPKNWNKILAMIKQLIKENKNDQTNL